MMKKQTAVEWLIQNIVEDQTIKAKSMSEWTTIYEKAKAMEKEQIEEAWKRGNLPTSLGRVLTEKDYYNETYGGDK
jgi:hypothetical protein